MQSHATDEVEQGDTIIHYCYWTARP